MPKMNPFAVMLATVAAFIIGGIWYSPLVFGNVYATERAVSPPTAVEDALSVKEILGEFIRWLVISSILANFLRRLHIHGVTAALRFGLWMWVAMYAALAGSVLHEAYPWRVYLIHAGDGLLKIAVITSILAFSQVRQGETP